jgi:RNA polymerase sigma-54 factor
MEMKIGLHLRQRQQLVMTPKLQQALKLLQMPSLELQQMLKQEIMENPLLEEIEDYEETVEDAEESGETQAEGDQPTAEGEASADPAADNTAAPEEERELKTDSGEAGAETVDWDEYFNDGFDLGNSEQEQEHKEEFFERSRREAVVSPTR